MQVYRQILPLADVQTQAELKAEIGALQEAWEQSNGLVEKRKALSETVIKVCRHSMDEQWLKCKGCIVIV